MSVNSPLARRMPGFDARHATRRARRTRVVVALVAVGVVAGVVFVFFGRATPRPAPVSRRSDSAAVVPRIVSTLATWRLTAPISRAVVVPGPAGAGRALIILGGETTGGVSASGAFGLDVTSGALTQVGDLMTATDDAAGAVIGGQAVVFGGASAPEPGVPPAAAASVQDLSDTVDSIAAGAAIPRSAVLGSLSPPRAAATAVTTGPVTYLVGGSDGASPDAAIMATTDGRHFAAVASLPVPVLYPAVAVLGHSLYVFGGLAAAGADAGRPVNTIQVVDLTHGRVTDSHHLPEPLAAAAAVVLGGHILLAGGDTVAPATGASPTTGTAAGSPTTSVPDVWWFEPSSGSCRMVGHLPVAVSHAGLAVVGPTAWLVGGESDGTPVASAQSVALAPASPPRRPPGTTR